MGIKNTTMKILVFTVSVAATSACICVTAAAQSGWDHFQKATELQKNGQVEEVVSELEQAVSIEPENAFYHNALGLAYIDAGNIDQAMQSLEKAIELNDNLPEAYSGLGVCYNAKGEYSESIKYFLKALDITPQESPDRAVIQNNLGQNYYLLKRYEEAENHLRQAVELNPNLLTAYINLGNVYTERGDFETAITYHQKAVDIAPEYALPRNNLAFSYYKLGNYEKALEEMEKVLQMDPDNEQFQKNAEFLRAELQKHKDSTYQEGPLAGLPKEITLNGDTAKAPGAGMQQAPEEEEVEPAEEVEMVGAEPVAEEPEAETAPAVEEPPEVYEAPAEEVAEAPVPETERRTYEREHAQAPQEAPVEVEPEGSAPQPVPYPEAVPVPEPSPQPVYEPPAIEEPERPAEVATVRDESGKPYKRIDRAHTALYPRERKKLEQETQQLEQPISVGELYRSAKYNLRTGDLESAQKDIDRALDIYPENPDYLLVAGLIRESQGRIHEAESIYSRVLEIDPNHSAGHNSFGHVQQTMGNMDIARREYEAALDLDADNGCAAANIGTVMVNEGMCAEAMEYLDQAILNQCLKAPVLNNISLCHFQDGDYDTAQTISHRALEKDPFDQTIVSNFSYIVEKSGNRYEPVKIYEDTRYDPFQKMMDYEKETPLTSLTPVDTLNFYDVFRNNYNRKMVLVVPFQNPRGTENWNPTPSESLTRRLENHLRETGYFDVKVADDVSGAVPFSEKISPDFINSLLTEYPEADVVYMGNTMRHENKTLQNTRFKGLKDTPYIE